MTGVAVPLWAAAGEVPEEVAAGKDPAPLNAAFDKIRDFLYPDRSGDLKWYINIERLADAKNGIPTALAGQEADNFTKAGAALEKWRKSPPAPADLAALQAELVKSTLEAMKALASKLGI